MANPFDIASAMLGKTEGADHAAVMDYLKTGGQNLDPATTAWCAAFVNASLQKAGLKGTGSNLARSFLNYGTPVKDPTPGDIAVYPRGGINSPYGHVGFVQSYDPKTGQVMLLAGNQGNAVSAKAYPYSGALGFRHPGDTATPAGTGPDVVAQQPVVHAPGVSSPQAATDIAGPRPAQAPGTAAAAAAGAPPPVYPTTLGAPKQGPPAPDTTPAATAVADKDPYTGLDKKGWRNALAHLAGGYKMPDMAKNDTNLGSLAMPPAARIDTPEIPTFDPNQVNMQRQQLAMAMQRLNSGRLY